MKSVTTAASAAILKGCMIAGLTGVQAIDELDLGPIKVKLMEKDEGEGWSVEQVNMAEKWYKRFLFLSLMHPTTPIVPSKTLDTFWHYHILDTMKYAEDCQNIFGYFLHHFPYFGMRGADDAKNLKDAFAHTNSLLKSQFGETLSELRQVFSSADIEASADCENAPNCAGGGCGDCQTGGCKGKIDHSRPEFVH